MALSIETIGAAMTLTGGAATRASQAAQAATGAAATAQEAAEQANTAAAKAKPYADEYNTMKAEGRMGDTDTRLITAQFQAHIRWLEKRITTLESQVAAMAGK